MDPMTPGGDKKTGEIAPARLSTAHDGGSGGHVRHGFIWNLLNFVFAQGAGVAIFLVLSRQLSVETFGVFALAAVLVDLFALNARWAAIDALVQRQDFTKKALSTAFWCLSAAAVLLIAIMALGSGALARVIEAPDVATVLPALGLTLILVPGAAVMESVLMRDLQFRAQAIRNILSTVIGGALGLAVAFGPSPEWALVAQRFGSNVATLLVLHFYTRWLPSFEFGVDSARPFAARTGQLWASMMLATAHMRIVEASIGARAGMIQLGLMRVGQRLYEALQGPVTSPIQALWVPIMSKLRTDRELAWRLFLDLSRVSAFIALPAFVGVGLIAEDLVALALDERYADAASVLFLLGLSGYLLPVGFFGNQIFAALDRSDLAMKLSLFALCLVAPSVWYASSYGASAALGASIAVMGAMGMFVTGLQVRMMGGTIKEFLGRVAAPYLATFAMTAALLAVAAWLPINDTLPRLAVQIAIGGVTYLGWLALFHRQAVRDTWAFISSARRPHDDAAPEGQPEAQTQATPANQKAEAMS